ncbi:MAG: hypothetical protein KGQ36_05400 [Rickettsiales bacterium]|nr:hypothetical protein [Rickettsiales bacterium]
MPKETQSQSIENFATKADLEKKINKSESRLEQRIDKLELRIESIKNELTIRLGKAIYFSAGLIMSSIGIAVAFLKF